MTENPFRHSVPLSNNETLNDKEFSHCEIPSGETPSGETPSDETPSDETPSDETFGLSYAAITLIMENSPDLYCITDESGRIVYSNPAFRNTLAYPAENRDDMKFYPVVHPDDIEGLCNGNSGTFSEFRMKGRQGQWIWMEGRNYGIEWKGRYLTVITARDISFRKADEERLIAQKKRVEVLYELSCILAGNRSNYHSILKLIAQRLSELIGDETLIRLVSGDGLLMDAAAFYHTNPKAQEFLNLISEYPQRIDEGLVGKICRTGEPVFIPVVNQSEFLKEVKCEYREFFESFIAHSFLMVPLKYEDRLLGVINLVRTSPDNPYTCEDLRLLVTISESIALALENARLYSEKVAEIEERRRTEMELKKALVNLASASKEMQDFVYAASHDLQEPLRMVASYTRLLEKRYKDRLDENANEFINYAVDGARRMQQQISDLLVYSRITTRAKPFEQVDMKKIVMQVLDFYSDRIRAYNIGVTVGELPQLYADPYQMRQLFDQLISNAIKFRAAESPQLFINAFPEDNKWKFCVMDNGIGINTQDKERIFIIFQRLHDKDTYPGTGTGLAICKKIVERHDGHIWVESEPGKSTGFYFTIAHRAE